MQVGDKIRFVLGEGFETGTIKQVNKSSVIVELKNRAKIKRHTEKHKCELIGNKND